MRERETRGGGRKGGKEGNGRRQGETEEEEQTKDREKKKEKNLVAGFLLPEGLLVYLRSRWILIFVGFKQWACGYVFSCRWISCFAMVNASCLIFTYDDTRRTNMYLPNVYITVHLQIGLYHGYTT